MSMANVAGRSLAVHDPIQGTAIPSWLLYPTDAPSTAQAFGPYTIELAVDAPAVGGPLDLVVISHGGGGTPWAHRGLASHLVRAGFAVVLPEHIGNSRSDNSLADTPANLVNRPRHLRLAADAAFADPVVGPLLTPGWLAAIGHSIGGYTVLAAAGGHPWMLPAHVLPAQRTNPSPETARLATPVAAEPDPRLRAAVLLAPAIGWFLPDATLRDVGVPLLVRTGAHDLQCPRREIERALRSLPDPARLDLADVAGAGHFAFQSPFPPELTRPEFPPSQDPPGFDRAAYQPVLHAEITAFLRAAPR